MDIQVPDRFDRQRRQVAIAALLPSRQKSINASTSTVIWSTGLSPKHGMRISESYVASVVSGLTPGRERAPDDRDIRDAGRSTRSASSHVSGRATVDGRFYIRERPVPSPGCPAGTDSLIVTGRSRRPEQSGDEANLISGR